MGHAEQYARMRARIAQQTQHLHNPHSFWDMYARMRARSDPYKSSQARYSAWDSGASLTGSRLQG